MQERDKLVKVFDNQAEAYNKYRPGYPGELIRELIDLTGLAPGADILEIGCGTGQITLDLLKAGFRITAVEKGSALAEIAARNTNAFPEAKIVNLPFEAFETPQKFQLAVSAQAFHWIKKEPGLNKISHLLEPDGSVALIWHLDKSQSTDFWQRTKPIYDYYFPNTKFSLIDSPSEHETYLQTRKDFQTVLRREYTWTQVYQKEDYLGLLSTFSMQMNLLPKKRESFFYAIADLIDTCGGKVERHYETVMILGKK